MSIYLRGLPAMAPEKAELIRAAAWPKPASSVSSLRTNPMGHTVRNTIPGLCNMSISQLGISRTHFSADPSTQNKTECDTPVHAAGQSGEGSRQNGSFCQIRFPCPNVCTSSYQVTRCNHICISFLMLAANRNKVGHLLEILSLQKNFSVVRAEKNE